MMEVLLSVGFAAGIAGVFGVVAQDVYEYYKEIKDDVKEEAHMIRVNRLAHEIETEFRIGDEVLYKGYKKGIIVDITDDCLSILLTRTNKVVSVPFLKEVM